MPPPLSSPERQQGFFVLKEKRKEVRLVPDAAGKRTELCGLSLPFVAIVVTVDRDSSVVYCGSQICRLGTENIGAERENLKVVYALFVLCYLLARFFLAVCKTPTVCLKRKRRSTASTPGTGSFAVSQCALGPCTSFLS